MKLTLSIRNASFIIYQFKKAEAIRDCLSEELANTLVECLSSFESSEDYIHVMKQFIEELEGCKTDKKDCICQTDTFPMPLLLAATKSGEDADKALEHFNKIYESAIKNSQKVWKNS